MAFDRFTHQAVEGLQLIALDKLTNQMKIEQSELVDNTNQVFQDYALVTLTASDDTPSGSFSEPSVPVIHLQLYLRYLMVGRPHAPAKRAAFSYSMERGARMVRFRASVRRIAIKTSATAE